MRDGEHTIQLPVILRSIVFGLMRSATSAIAMRTSLRMMATRHARGDFLRAIPLRQQNFSADLPELADCI
jgi:hypothetical protein